MRSFYNRPILSKADVLALGLNQNNSIAQRRLAVLDDNKDLFIYQVRVYGRTRPMVKLGGFVCFINPQFICRKMKYVIYCSAGSMVSTFVWSENENFLAAVKHGKLTVWYYPGISLVDKELFDLIAQERDFL